MNESLFEKGSICSLNISRWSGQASLTREDLRNMGVDPDAMPSELATRGKKFLVCPASLKGIMEVEARARQYLAKHSASFPVTGCTFVPARSIDSITAMLKEFQQSFNKEVDAFIGSFSGYVQYISGNYPDFWEKCLKPLYPADPNTLRRHFGFRFLFFRVDASTVAQKQELQEMVSEFVGEYVQTMRKEVVKFCDLVRARVTGTVAPDEKEVKSFTGRTLGALRKYADAFNEMNIFGDDEIAQLLYKFRTDFAGDTASVKDFKSEDTKAHALQAVGAIKDKALDTIDYITNLKRRIVI